MRTMIPRFWVIRRRLAPRNDGWTNTLQVAYLGPKCRCGWKSPSWQSGLEGTPFRKEAWALLRKVPYGETVSYGGLARRLELKRADGRRVSARAIGGAVHRNPIALIVPCHRVVGADGSLTGYAGGIETKIRLLQLEGVLKQTERMDVDCESIDRIWRSTR